ncbi:MAG TPA: SDR family oxidoreductase [bacterium]|nr:SDR family oxidoreductase [bacterium]
MTIEFNNQIVLVAGGTGGLGRAVSLAFLAAGAEVIVTYRSESEFAALRESAPPSVSLAGQKVDVTDAAQVGAMVADIVARYGHLDALVNTVGGYSGGATLWETAPDVLEQMLALNLRAGFVLTRAVLPVMIKQRRGALVNIAAKAALDPAARGGVYAASKAAALAMMDALAKEVRGTGVRVNSVLPSTIDTEANRRAMPQANHAKWPKPDEIARVILFLCSDAGRVVHGAAVPVYGAD